MNRWTGPDFRVIQFRDSTASGAGHRLEARVRVPALGGWHLRQHGFGRRQRRPELDRVRRPRVLAAPERNLRRRQRRTEIRKSFEKVGALKCRSGGLVGRVTNSDASDLSLMPLGFNNTHPFLEETHFNKY